AHDLAVPAGELECVRAPPMIGADRRDLAIMLARPPASGMAFEQETVLLHQSVDALGVDRGQTVGSPLALEERGDPPVPIGWPRVDKGTDRTGELNIARSLLRPATSSAALAPFEPDERSASGTGQYPRAGFTGAVRHGPWRRG